MKTLNPYALYVRCDGAMDYDPQNSGGIGFVITFPDFIPIAPISFSKGTYVKGNIERLELEAIIQAMNETIHVCKTHFNLLTRINRIIIVTDRYGLRDEDKTSPYRIRGWRRNGWKNYEGKPIKNHDLLDELDKTRSKLSSLTHSPVDIEWQPSKKNKGPDKLAKAGKQGGPSIDKLVKRGEKIGRRKYRDVEITYKYLKPNDVLHINIFHKDPVQSEYEISAEVCSGSQEGCKLKIYADDILSNKLKRGNEFEVRIKTVYNHHIRIYRGIKRLRKGMPGDPAKGNSS